MTPEEALKHIGSLVEGVDEHTKPAILLPTIKNIQELLRKADEAEREARKSVRSIIKEATATKGR
ncbi:hypothetical protein [Bosea sp. MMO-172]|uniref:hypothetical protein n=1 Tax=Bosea sp. MMO-172 TaxID=3127885 RepID=UPI0030187CBE